MTDDMRQGITDLNQKFTGLDQKFAGLDQKYADLSQDVAGLKTDMVEVKSRLTSVEKTVRKTAIIVAGHTERFVWIEERLKKLDMLDDIKKSLEVFTAEIMASRSDRTLLGKGFFDQQVTLTDHELRLTRLERRSRPN